ncbi:arginine--tRNA ligase [Clostridium oryzae]|uniref:Arginine--tRNA ligase n=1 Tax=Clostridium oryzae TaxID=1450648 RepID=A0A1V4IH88_9CLOT|nr:arginine--tRNA ligase [Clostridium oryzae]OPJ59286.1 arginine--tRNA ligase [Clostridium oryzae]
MEKFLDELTKIVEDAFEASGYDGIYGKMSLSDRPDLCQFQCNGALPAAKAYKKAPFMIAKDVVEKLENSDVFEKVFTAGPGFINFIVKDTFLTQYLNSMKSEEKFGLKAAENPKTIIIDFGGANVAKPLHVGHLRSAIIGESIKRICKYLGHTVIGDVHLGDWGLQIGMVISELYRRKPELPYFDDNFSGEYPKEPPFTIDELSEIYPAASKLAKSDEAAMEAAKKATFELQKGKPGYIAIWKHILSVSTADLKKNYGALNVEFDLWKGESDAEEYIPDMLKYLNENNYTHKSEGALVVDVAKEDDTYEIPPIILLKSDGAVLYGTTDLATIVQRIKDYNPDEIIYVVDKRQGLHFEQVFRCAKKTNIADEKLKLQFIGFGTMNGKDGKPFKTREGGVMKLHDLIQLIKDNAKGKLKDDRDFSEEETEEIARIIGTAALKYGDLSNAVTKDYVFDLDRFSSFEGNTGPYLLYTVVRIKSILKKAAEDGVNASNSILTPTNNVERDLMLKLVKFGEAIEGSYEDKAPNKICEYLYDLSNLFNRFYHENKILSEEDLNKKASWIALLKLTLGILDTGLNLLGIESPERM